MHLANYRSLLQHMKKLVFVYNADAGFFHALSDFAHKIVSPDTYPCSLCMLTHGKLGMREEWKSFVEGLELPAEFLHRDEFKSNYPGFTELLPAVFLVTDQLPEVVVDSNQLNSLDSVQELIQLVKNAT